MQSHLTIFTKQHNAKSSAQDEINEIFDSADKYINLLLANSEGLPLHTEILYLSGDVEKFRDDLLNAVKYNEELAGRLAAREFRNVFSIACNPDLSSADKVKQLELFRNHMRGSTMSLKERLTRDTMLAIGLALIPLVAIIITSILFTPLSLIALGAALPILATVSIAMFFYNQEKMTERKLTRGEDLSKNMISLVKNHNYLFAKPKIAEIAPPSYEQVQHGMA